MVQEERSKPDDGRNSAACPVEQGSDLQKNRSIQITHDRTLIP